VQAEKEILLVALPLIVQEIALQSANILTRVLIALYYIHKPDWVIPIGARFMGTVKILTWPKSHKPI